ncbi:MAG TPA: hypothetical protein VMW56_02505 [Candidatus Margulisiibacteriota bacterium]|nr:hypothetical protein [Candidatus Margulisiibacteriota bacterium]
MDDLTKILLTSSLTVIGGVLVFVAGQSLGKFVIEPVHDLKKLIGEVRYALVFHAQAIHTPVGDRTREDMAAETLRRLSCDLRSKVGAIPFYRLWSTISCGFLPSKHDAFAASTELLGLSNSVHQPDRARNADRVADIERLLKYEPVE